MSSFSEFQAMQIVQRMQALRGQVDRFATHATMLANASSSLDALALLEEANNLAKNLIASRKDFETAEAYTGTLSRALPSRPPASGGMAPAAKWGNEFRAGSKQFAVAVQNAEKAMQKLFDAADLKINSPSRTATPADNGFEMALGFADLLMKWVEARKRKAS